MEATENKGILKTCLIIGGTILSCSFGAYAFRKIHRLINRPEQIGEEGFTQYEVKTGDDAREEPGRSDGAQSTRSNLSNWTQTFEEVVIEIPVAADVSSKDGPLYQDIAPDECSWELDGKGPRRLLTISLIKGAFQRGHWTQLMMDPNEEVEAK